MRGVCFVALISACSGTADEVIDETYSYTVDVHPFGAERPEPSPQLVVLIDGIARNHAEFRFASIDEAANANLELQLAYGTDIVTTYRVILSVDDCNPPWGGVTPFPPVVVRDNYCAFDHGEIRGNSRALQTATTGCIGDGFCAPPCLVHDGSGCAAGQRCTSRITHFDPIFSRLGCAPAGPKQLGESCGYVADGATSYDDCGIGLLCVEAVCREVCDYQNLDGCTNVAGHSSDIRVRL